MPAVHAVLYTWSSCSFCARAKALLERHGVPYVEEALDGNRDRLRRLQARFGARTVPLILLDGEPVAGLAALEELARSGALGPEV